MSDPTARVRAARGAGAFVLVDLITGLAAYCVITLAGLWLFSVTWIRIASEARSRGIAFSTQAQLDLAWLGAFLALPVAAIVIYLAVRAYGLPRDVLRTGGRTTLYQVGILFHRAKLESPCH
jgi:hypothetical protein